MKREACYELDTFSSSLSGIPQVQFADLEAPFSKAQKGSAVHESEKLVWIEFGRRVNSWASVFELEQLAHQSLAEKLGLFFVPASLGRPKREREGEKLCSNWAEKKKLSSRRK